MEASSNPQYTQNTVWSHLLATFPKNCSGENAKCRDWVVRFVERTHPPPSAKDVMDALQKNIGSLTPGMKIAMPCDGFRLCLELSVITRTDVEDPIEVISKRLEEKGVEHVVLPKLSER